ncbi:MAG: 9-O-acetylesterase, partial [Lentisphaerae bacterium]
MLLFCLIAAMLTVVWSEEDVQFRLHRLFQDNMMLQAEQPVRVFGFARPGCEVRVELAGQQVTARTGKDGQ